MKKLLLSIFLVISLAITSFAAEPFFTDVIVTSPNGIWTDARAYSTLNDAVAAIGANERTIVIASPQVVTSLTVPSTSTLKFERNGSITNSDYLNIQTKNIIAENRQIFTGVGNIDFAAGSELKTGWFSNIESAFALTTNDTVTLEVSKPATVTANYSPNANINLKWTSPGNILTVTAGTTLSNLKNIEAGNFQIFGTTGDVDFVAGAVAKTGWFANIESAFNLTSDDTITLVVTKPQTITTSTSPGNNINLKWESPGNILTLGAGVIVGNLLNIEAGNYQLFAGTGDFDFLDGSRLKLGWFSSLQAALAWVENEEVTIVVTGSNQVSTDETSTVNEYFDLISEQGQFSVDIGHILTIYSPANIKAADNQQIKTGAGTLAFTIPGFIPSSWMGATGDGTTDDKAAIDEAIAANSAGIATANFGSDHYAYDEAGSNMQTNNAIYASVKDINLTAPARLLMLGNKDANSNMSTNRFIQKDTQVSLSNDYMRDMLRFDRDITNNSGTAATSLNISTVHHGAAAGTVGGYHNVQSIVVSDAVLSPVSEIASFMAVASSVGGANPWAVDARAILSTVQPSLAYGGSFVIEDNIGTTGNRSAGLNVASAGSVRPNYGILMDQGARASFKSGILINQQDSGLATEYMDYGLRLEAASEGTTTEPGSIQVGINFVNINTYELQSNDDMRVRLGASNIDFLGVYKSNGSLGGKVLAGGQAIFNGLAFQNIGTFPETTLATTPGVSYYSMWKTFTRGTGAVTITSFTSINGENPILCILGGGGATPDIVQSNATIVLAGGDWVGESGNMLLLVYENAKWYEISRSRNRLVAMGGGAAPTLGTIGGSGPAAAAQNSWVQLKDAAGVSFWVPAWK